MIESLVVSASQDAGGCTISRQNSLEFQSVVPEYILPPPPPAATEIPRGGWVKKEAISKGVGVAYRGFFFPGGLLPVFKTSIIACNYHLLATVGQIIFFHGLCDSFLLYNCRRIMDELLVI